MTTAATALQNHLYAEEASRSVTSNVHKHGALWHTVKSTASSSCNVGYDSHYQALADTIRSVLQRHRLDAFEDGYESELAAVMTQLLAAQGADLVSAFPLAALCGLPDNPFAEMLRWVGSVSHSETHEARRRFLEQCLAHSAPSVRDGAVLGLASMDDPAALRALSKAERQETRNWLRQAIRQVIDQLEETNRCAVAPPHRQASSLGSSRR